MMIPKLGIGSQVSTRKGRYYYVRRSHFAYTEDMGVWLTKEQALEVIRIVEAHNPWIPVSERLPKEEHKHSVLSKEVFVSDGREVWKSKWTVSGKQWSYTNSPSYTFPITHWKPIVLPEQEQ